MVSADIIMIGFYLLLIVGIGLYRGKTIQTDCEFAIAGRNVSIHLIGFSAFASWIGLAGTFGTPENIYKCGISGSWWFFFWFPGILLMAYFLAFRLRKRLFVTVPELIAEKTSKQIGLLASLLVSWNYLAWVAVQVFALGLIFSTFTPLDSTTGSILAFLIMISYVLSGGFRSVVRTDLIQAAMMIFFIVVLAPCLILANYNVSEIFRKTQNIPNFYTLFGGVDGKTLFIWFLSLFPAAFIDPGGLQRVFSAERPEVARNGLYYSAILYVIFGVAITFLGVAAKAILPDIEAAKSIPLLMAHILPTGLNGLMVATFIGIAMSTADTALLVVSNTMQRDIYSSFRPNISEKERLVVNRVLILVLGLLALLIALRGQGVVTILIYGFSLYVPGLLLPVIAASFEWNIPPWAILWTILSGVISSVVWLYLGEPVIPAIAIGLMTSGVPFFAGFLLRNKTPIEIV